MVVKSSHIFFVYIGFPQMAILLRWVANKISPQMAILLRRVANKISPQMHIR